MGELFKELMLNSTHCYPQYGSFHRGPFVLSAVYDKDKSNPSILQTKFGGGKKKKKVQLKIQMKLLWFTHSKNQRYKLVKRKKKKKGSLTLLCRIFFI